MFTELSGGVHTDRAGLHNGDLKGQDVAMFWLFSSRVLSFALSRSILVTDRLSFLIGPLVTAALWLRGERVDNTAELVATATVATTLAVILLRIIAAPFFVWKEDQAVIAGLKHDLARPERAGAEEIDRLRAQKRLNLAAELVEFQMLCAVSGGGDAYNGRAQKRIMRLAAEVNPPRVFFRLLGLVYEAGLRLEGNRESDDERDRCVTLTMALVDFLHGKATERRLMEIEEEYSK